MELRNYINPNQKVMRDPKYISVEKWKLLMNSFVEAQFKGGGVLRTHNGQTSEFIGRLE